ncbi:long-chain-fatty-acid--CoA ligase FadD1 [Oceaniserpentilla sp. 4NH20-0058]|uniref:AMP-binding protein n=1 Tax=Oceaniserpentilla sp. 4NH20-0058 TaxID=3127660 RepID=UPI0031054C65
MNDTFFSDQYPKGLPAMVNIDKYKNVVEVFNKSVKKFADRPAFTALGQTLSYADIDRLSADFAAYLQNNTGLQKGDRIAVQLPNLLQYPIVVFGAMRAGLVVVNTNPLYTEREMEHQFNDSGAKALVVLAQMAGKASRVVPKTQIETVIVTQAGDLCSPIKRTLVNFVIKNIRKEVEPYIIPGHVKLLDTLKAGAKSSYKHVDTEPEDICVLQYTGGTTGVAKGAMLTNRNIVANMSQAHPLFMMGLNPDGGTESKIVIAPLPLYHIYAFTANCMVIMETGNHNVLIPNPRDLPGFIKELKKWKFNGFLGLNTLFVGLCNNPDFRALDFSNLQLTISGGMALTKSAADTWKEVTGCEINEGYGMTETSPIASFNPPGHAQLGTIGLPVSNTLCKVIDEDGTDLPLGEAGELCVKGPQVMKGYWQRPEATAETITEDGWLKTGDMAVILENGYMKIVDRKKDMIIVSGFNVYPNEIEEVVSSHPDIIECAAVGMPDEISGEQVKVFAVKSNSSVTEKDVREYCRERLTAYKVPKMVEFRDELPKTNVGKILRRELRDEETA